MHQNDKNNYCVDKVYAQTRFEAILETWRKFLSWNLWNLVLREELPMWLIGRDCPLPTAIWSGPLYWDWIKRLLRLAVIWSDAPELVNHGSEFPMIVVLEAIAITTNFVGGFLPWRAKSILW